MPKKAKCLYCELEDASHCETISVSITSRKYWTNVLFRIQRKIITVKDLSYTHPCNDEHRQKMQNMRSVAKWTNQAKIKTRLSKVVLATKALRVEQKLYNSVLNIQGEDSMQAKIQKLKVNQKKTLLCQRMRRLRELMPQAPEDTALVDAFLQREFANARLAAARDLT